MQHKFRQINRFLEIVDDVLDSLPDHKELRVVDFGSGKSYLTFALHHLLTRIRGRSAKIIGVDRKSDVIKECQRIADRLNCCGLAFQNQDITQFQTNESIDLMVSLHACDTATDAALAKAVEWKVTAILAVPCCQHELASTLSLAKELTILGEHGIIRERFAALATDAIRAKLLEFCGYQTQILEFIDLEHTPKNLLIRGIRRDAQQLDTAALKNYFQFRSLLTKEHPALERALARRLGTTVEGDE